MDPLLYWLDRIQPSERSLVGDKAFYLSQQAQAGRAVIPGFAIATPALREFLATYDWSEPLLAELLTSTLHVNVDNLHQLQGLAQHIREEICAAELPETWIDRLKSAVDRLNSRVLIFRPCLVQTVKSKTSKSNIRCPQISGLLESRICTNHPEILAQTLKETWAELFTARSLFYWQRSGMILPELDMAILVQPVWNAIAAGSVETEVDIWQIQATWGLGMSIPAGKTIPDTYQINPATGKVQQKTLGNKLIAYHLPSSEPKKLDFFESAIAQNPTTEQLIDSPLEPEVSTATNLDGCESIKPLILSEEQQQKYALESPLLNELISLTKTLVSELGSRLVLDWLVCPSPTPESLETGQIASLDSDSFPGAKVYLTKVSLLEYSQKKKKLSDQTATDVDRLPQNNNDPWLIGVGAAPGEAIARAFVIRDSRKLPEQIPPGSIIVTKTINLDTLFSLQKAAGVIAEQGGITSHAAILARELGIPAVVSAAGAIEKIQPEQQLMINGERGTIYQISEPMSEPDSASYRTKVPQEQFTSDLSETEPKKMGLGKVISTFPPIATQLLVNLSQPKSLEQIGDLPVEGVGLLRSELMMLDIVGDRHPQQWIEAQRQDEFVELISDAVIQIARYMFPRPVFYRSCDLPCFGQEEETNPALGVHGTFSYLLDSSLFELELAALDRVQTDGYSNINLILPFIRSVEEFIFCRQRVEQTGLNRVNGFQLWIMAEVPSVLFLLEDYIKAGVQGIAIGTNDLTQLLLGADRNHPQFESVFDARHPAVKAAIFQLISMAKKGGIPCSVCGQAASIYPDFLDDLVRWGVTIISVEPISFENTYRAIARSEKRLILEAARSQL